MRSDARRRGSTGATRASRKPSASAHQHVGAGRGLVRGVDGVQRRGRDRSVDARGCDRSVENATTTSSRGAGTGPPGEIGREQRTRERDVGHRCAEGVGDDRGFHPARERARPPGCRRAARASPRRAPRRRAASAASASSRSATVAGPSSRASWRAARRSSACSAVSRVSTAGNVVLLKRERNTRGGGQAARASV